MCYAYNHLYYTAMMLLLVESRFHSVGRHSWLKRDARFLYFQSMMKTWCSFFVFSIYCIVTCHDSIHTKSNHHSRCFLLFLCSIPIQILNAIYIFVQIVIHNTWWLLLLLYCTLPKYCWFHEKYTNTVFQQHHCSNICYIFQCLCFK